MENVNYLWDVTLPKTRLPFAYVTNQKLFT